MNHIIRDFAYKLTSKRVNENKLDIKQIDLKEDDIFYFNLSSNSIISFIYEGKTHYFRECPRIYSFNEYFNNSINNFFSTLKHLGINKAHFGEENPINIDFTDDIIAKFKKYIKNCTLNKQFFKTMSNLDVFSQKHNFSIWNKTEYTCDFFNAFGLQDLEKDLTDIAVYFLWYMKSAATNYRVLKIVRGKNFSFFSAVKSISSRIVAEELKLEHLITDAKWCKINIEGKNSIFGLLSPAADGNRMLDCKAELNGSLQNNLTNLNVLDIICFQLDHGPNNYNLHIKENNVYFVCAFDNDNPYTFFPIPFISNSFSAASPFVDKNALIQRPYFDKNLYEHILNLNFKTLKKRLNPYLNFLQIAALSCRIKKLIKALDYTKIKNPHLLINPDEWNLQTASLEASGKYGVTY